MKNPESNDIKTGNINTGMHILWAPQTVIDKSNTHNPYKIMGCFDFTNRHKDLTPPNNYSHTKK